METPGLMLKREREAQGMTLSELARVTRIPESALEHIENNNFEDFPAEVFTRGFLRNYARQLSIPATDIIQAYENLMREQHRSLEPVEELPVEQMAMPNYTTQESAVPANDNEPRFSFRFAYIAIILIAVASVGLSVLFMGTGEAEESDADFTTQTGNTTESPFLISNTSEGWNAD